MPEPLIRGHIVLHTANFIRTQTDRATSQRFTEEISLELQAALEQISPSAWYPRQYQVDLLKALIAAKGGGDATYADLMRCGAAMVNVENEFVRLLMKVLTPELFVKKLPKFWLRDHRNSGSLDVESFQAVERVGQLRLRGITGYDHSAVVWLGWIRRVLEVLAGPRAEVRQVGWSWSTPAPSEVSYEVKWT